MENTYRTFLKRLITRLKASRFDKTADDNPYRVFLEGLIGRLETSPVSSPSDLIYLINRTLLDLDEWPKEEDFNIRVGRKIYVAASFPRKDEASDLAMRLGLLDHIIVSEWLKQDRDFQSPLAGSRFAKRDLEEIMAADILVCLTGDTLSRGGRHSEFGMALALNKGIYIIGPRESVFHHHPNVRQYDDIQSFLSHVEMSWQS